MTSEIYEDDFCLDCELPIDECLCWMDEEDEYWDEM